MNSNEMNELLATVDTESNDPDVLKQSIGKIIKIACARNAQVNEFVIFCKDNADRFPSDQKIKLLTLIETL